MPEITEQQQIELRTSEVQEIITQIPSGMVRWGMTALLVVMLILLGFSWFIEYPDILQAKVVITTSTPPITMISRSNGSLVLVKREGDEVKKGELIAYLRTNASHEAILDLEKYVRSDHNDYSPKLQYSVGELQQDYGLFLSTSSELSLFKSSDIYDKQIRQIKDQKNTYLKLNKFLVIQVNLAKQELILAKEKFKVDSTLFSQKVTASVDYNKDKSAWIQEQIAFNNAETALVYNELQINQSSKQISDLEIQKKESEQKLIIAQENSKKVLLAHIDKWKESYLFLAPEKGKIAFTGFKEDEMFIETGKPVLTILPSNKILVARANLPVFNSGKVKEGQRVNIRLDNYPFEQYGSVTGKIISISAIPNEDTYVVHVSLPKGLLTNQNKLLPFKHQLNGTTEIITEELRLMDRFFYQFRKIFKR